MKTLLVVNLTSKTPTLDGSADWTPPPFTFGEKPVFALRFQQDVAGSPVDYYPTVNGLQAAIGNVDARPLGGSTKIKIGPDAQSGANTIATAVGPNVKASDLQAAINALSSIGTYGNVVVSQVDDSFLLVFGTGAAEVTITLVDNKFWPVSFGRVNAHLKDGVWVHELRFTQSPVAFTDASAPVVPAGPSVSRVQGGGSSGDLFWNEIQALYVPPDFRGSYQLKKGDARTALLSKSDGPDQLKTALSVFGNGFNVTNPLPNTANIEYINDFQGTGEDLLEVEVFNAPPGDLTFTLLLDRPELWSMLRKLPQVTLPLQVLLSITDEDAVVRVKEAFTINVTIVRPVIFPELATTPNIDWLQPPSPKDYIPFDPSQVITGQQYFQAVIGDASHTSFAIAHGLATEAVYVFVRQNVSNGRQLVDGVDFSVVINSADQVTVTALTGAPGVNAWAAIVMSAQTVAAFAEDLVLTMGQVTGLNAALTNLGNRLTTVEGLLPTGGLSVANTAIDQGTFTIPIVPQKNVTLFLRDEDPAKLPARAPFMLPAAHDASVTDTSVVPATTAGSVWKNNSGGDLIIPGGGLIRSSVSPDQGNIAGDGRMVYPVRRSGTTISYYPIPFEQQLWNMFINDKMFPVGTKCTVLFSIALQLINATSEAQYVVVIEKGIAARDVIGGPDTTDTNLAGITWDVATPILRQQIILTPALITHTFGCVIANAAGGFSANALLYNQIVANNPAAPASANFALRARLIEFDTEDSITTARGWIQYSIVPPAAGTLGASIA